MTYPTVGTDHAPRPNSVRFALGLLVFLGVSAVGGGIGMVFGLGGESMLPAEWLDSIPAVDSWLFPGLVLGLGFGIGSLIVAWGLARRPEWNWLRPLERATGLHWSWSATVAMGIAQMIWIGLELVYLPEPSWLQTIYGATGLALAAIPWLTSMRSHLAVPTSRASNRWRARGPEGATR